MIRSFTDLLGDIRRYLPADECNRFSAAASQIKCGVVQSRDRAEPSIIDFVPLGFDAEEWDEVNKVGCGMVPHLVLSIKTSQWMGERYPRHRDGTLRITLELWRFDPMPQPENQEVKLVVWHKVPDLVRRANGLKLRELSSSLRGTTPTVRVRMQPVVRPSLRETWDAWGVELIPTPCVSVEVGVREEVIEKSIIFCNLNLVHASGPVQRQELRMVRKSLLVDGEIAVLGADYNEVRLNLENPPQTEAFELTRKKIWELDVEVAETLPLASHKRWRERVKIFRGSNMPRRVAKRKAFFEKSAARLRCAALRKEMKELTEEAARLSAEIREWKEGGR